MIINATMKVVITIPAYNEEETISKVISEINEEMFKTDYNYSILVYNDGSQDKTTKVAKKAGAIVVSHKKNRGLAQTFTDEMQECLKSKADIIVHTDADGQYPAKFIPQLIKKIEEGYDLVLGSRFKGRIESMSLMKKLGNKTFSKVFSRILKTKITDTTTGFRAFTKDVAEEIKLINTFTYTQEQLIKAGKQNFRITEIPIDSRKTRKSRLFGNPFEYAIKAWINILRIYRDYEPLKFFGRIGLILIAFGLIIAFYFVYLHFTTGITGHLGLLLLMLLLITTGLHIILFGFLADMMKK